jgi:hypothetical protein
MPQTTLAQAQTEFMGLGQACIIASHILDDSDGSDDGRSFDDEDAPDFDESFSDKDAAELIEAQGITFLQLAMSLSGDGSRGPYFQFPKSRDFFQCCLRSPDRIFRFIFR